MSKSKSIKFRLLGYSIILSVLTFSILGLVANYFIASFFKDNIAFWEQKTTSDFDELAKSQAHQIRSFLSYVYSEVENGRVSFEEAKESAISYVRNFRYRDASLGGYFFVYTSEGICVVMPTLVEREGLDCWDYEDINGQRYIRGFVETAKSGGDGGIVEFYSRRFDVDLDKPELKRNYVMYFEPFDWVFGTGNFVEDISKAVAVQEESIITFRNQIEFILFVIFIVMLALSIAVLHRYIVLLHKRRKDELSVQVNAFKMEFLSNASHELKTPLTVISNHAQLTRMYAEGVQTRDAYVASKMKIVISEAERMAMMIEQLIDAACIEEGRMCYNIAVVDVVAVIHDAVTKYSPALMENGNTYSLELPENLALVRCDKERVRQVLLNLLSNAARFTRKGTITVSVKNEGRFIAVTVTDTGEGIPDEIIDVVFDRYTTTTPDSDKSVAGTGLGLHISKHIIENHGGTIIVESKRGYGTTVVFTLPVAEGGEENE